MLEVGSNCTGAGEERDGGRGKDCRTEATHTGNVCVPVKAPHRTLQPASSLGLGKPLNR